MSFQRSLFEQEISQNWTPPIELRHLPNGVNAIDLETRDPLLLTHGPGWCFGKSGGEILGISIANDEWCDYIPIAHQGTLCPITPENVFNWLRDELKNDKVHLANHNISYDLGWLSTKNIKPAGKIFDTATAAPLIDENRNSYSLDALGKDYVGESKAKEWHEARRALGLPKNTPHSKIVCRLQELPAFMVAPYAIQDAVLARKLWFKLEPLLEKENLWQIFDLETRLIPVLLAMRKQGVRIDVDGAEKLQKTFDKQLKEKQKQIKDLVGFDVQIWAADSIAKAFDKLGIEYKKSGYITELGKPSFKAAFLEQHPHQLCKLIIESRKLEKVKGTFLEGHVLSHIVNGRIHAEFSPLRRSNDEGEHKGGAVTGRFSSSNPNLQNLPSDRSDAELAELIRGVFLPDVGAEWGSCDYMSQEPRLLTHFAYISGIKSILPFYNAFHANPRLRFHQLSADISGLRLRIAKDLMLGRIYGMGNCKTAKMYLKLPTKMIPSRHDPDKLIEIAGEEAMKIINQFDEKLSFAKEMNELCTRKAEKRNWIRTILGRIRHFQCEAHPKGAFPYKSLNCLIQGSASDCLKQAMVNLFEMDGVVPLVTVHDELGLNLYSREDALKYKQRMIEAVKLCIPTECDLEIGRSWGESGSSRKVTL